MDSRPAANLAGLTPSELLHLVVTHRRQLILPSIVCGVLALGYALFMSRYWEATQGFVVRSEATTRVENKPGKFADLYQMRTFQETILELAKSKQVIAATLKAVEQSSTGRPATEPTASQVEKFRKRLSLLPPGGAEFGKTEVCYLQVKDTDRERAMQLVAELGKQVDQRLRRLRAEQSHSLSDELSQQVSLAQAALDIETKRLAEFEAQVGADLGELRMLNASYSGQSDLRQQAIQLNDERRTAETAVRLSEQLLKELHAAQQDPQQLVAMPNSLLTSQPTLRRLKDGLVDAQLHAARLGGTRTAEHPQVQAAVQSVETIRQDLHDELDVAIRGVQVELQLGKNQVAKLVQQQQGVQQRLNRLAGLRAGYANRMSAVENSRLVLDQAQKQLGEVSATEAAAQTASLVTAIDQPETGAYPGGPSRASIVLGGTLGGFGLGMGWVFLTLTPPPVTGGSTATAAAREPEVVGRPQVAMPARRRVASTLSPSVSEQIAKILAARGASLPVEVGS